MVEQVILHTIHFLKQCGTIAHFLFKNKQAHTQERGKRECTHLSPPLEVSFALALNITVITVSKTTHI